MSVKIIVSYDGTRNEDDAIALGRLFAGAGAEVALAYVRHTHEPDRNRETLVEHEARELLDRGAELYGGPQASTLARHVVTDRSTPQGLRALAQEGIQPHQGDVRVLLGGLAGHHLLQRRDGHRVLVPRLMHLREVGQ